MSKINKRNRFAEEIFSYCTVKDGQIFLFWHQKQVKILKGPVAQKFLQDIANQDQRGIQLVIAKITRNFKHGNER